MLPKLSKKILVTKVLLLSIVASTALLSAENTMDQHKNKKTSEAEKGYKTKDIEKGWAFGDDAETQAEPEKVIDGVKKSKRDPATILEEILVINKEQLKEQKKIREILEEQFDPKPKMITKEDGTKCIANSSADCFDFPLIAEAKRVPVMANYLLHPENDKAVGEWKKWFAKYLNHTFDIGMATEYDTAANGSNTFQTDYRTDGFDSSGGYFNVAKKEHNTALLNAFGTSGLSLKIYLGKTVDLDLYSIDQIAMFCKDNNKLNIELVFMTKASAETFAGAQESLPFVKEALTRSNVTKRMALKDEIPNTLQATPAYAPKFKGADKMYERIIKTGKISKDSLATAIIDWMIFEKIVNPAQLNDARIWKDSGNYGIEYIQKTYQKNVKEVK